MPAERCYVGVQLNGAEQFFQRDTEQKGKDGKWHAVPYFVLNRSEAAVMSEEAARLFVARLQSKGVNPWIVDAKDGRRIEFTSNESLRSQHGDQRTPVRATLDDENSPEARWYKLIPVNRPDGGPMWLLKCLVPGVPDPQLIYEKDPLSCLQRAQDLNFSQYGERAPAPEPQAPPARNSSVVRRRPGDQYND
ncbi:MAG: hypothetical protein JWO71_1305 [Candidatus Acidoferrum typicum]|nr:hypothetical protein [Candidatus Acidoferrum typicum]